jgi:hypothetical protein
MDIDHRVDQGRVVPVAISQLGAPFVERLFREAEHPAGHRHGNPFGGKVTDQRVSHFGSVSRAKNAAARRRISFSCSSVRFRFFSSRSSADSELRRERVGHDDFLSCKDESSHDRSQPNQGQTPRRSQVQILPPPPTRMQEGPVQSHRAFYADRIL